MHSTSYRSGLSRYQLILVVSTQNTMNDLKTYNLLIIGGGPAGVWAAIAASTFGKSVALVEKQQDIGGAGINTGTVPSKTLRETALTLSGLRSRNLYGVDLSLRREVTVADFLGHEEHVKEAFHGTITERLKTLNAEIFRGTGSFVDVHTIRVKPNLRGREIDTSRPEGEIHLRGEKILIAQNHVPATCPGRKKGCDLN
jgi:NAD(P) transhydrogenase